MDDTTFRSGEIILLDGLYKCGSDSCERQVWGVSGRRFPELGCGHETSWRLLRRRVDHMF